MVDGIGRLPSVGPRGPVGSDLEDEALASAARVRYRADGIVGIEPDLAIRAVLDPDEQLLAVREVATVGSVSTPRERALFGRLAITTKRLLVLDGQSVTLARLEELDDVTIATNRLLVMLTTGVSFIIDTAQPRLLRVELAAARASRSPVTQMRLSTSGSR
jgi:hypothetical protein